MLIDHLKLPSPPRYHTTASSARLECRFLHSSSRFARTFGLNEVSLFHIVETQLPLTIPRLFRFVDRLFCHLDLGLRTFPASQTSVNTTDLVGSSAGNSPTRDTHDVEKGSTLESTSDPLLHQSIFLVVGDGVQLLDVFGGYHSPDLSQDAWAFDSQWGRDSPVSSISSVYSVRLYG